MSEPGWEGAPAQPTKQAGAGCRGACAGHEAGDHEEGEDEDQQHRRGREGPLDVHRLGAAGTV